ncbi:MAG: phosphopentomutase [Desulfobacteraceae bacterium]|nr:phosphopentomutase [Desulfobacteraceae bacterium]
MGALPDAASYGDAGAHTAYNICKAVKGPKWPVLKALGLGNCAMLSGKTLPGCEAVENPLADYGIMAEKSSGKDTTTGHWELAGLELDSPFHIFDPEYPSFPQPLVDELQAAIGRKIIGNCSASGTQIIDTLGQQHMSSGAPICYTSADSVFQIAAHEDVIPIETLYGICRTARQLCDAYQVARVIARPFTGSPGSFIRTGRRKDFSIRLPGKTVLDHLSDKGVITIGVGKIGNIFNETGLACTYPEKGNQACMAKTAQLMSQPVSSGALIFVNLVDTDMLYGHRRDAQGYFKAVSEIDQWLKHVITRITEQDLLIITADHGCDPAFRGTDHTREYVPLLSYRTNRAGRNLGVRKQFSDVAQTLCDFFRTAPFSKANSFY